MGLLEYLAGLADTGKRNVKAGLLDPELFATRVAENARDWGRGLLNGDRKSVVPEVRAAGQKQQMDAASQLFGGGAIKVWHGSPHKFDKFDFSKIGTGEGAQAYGHGGYFAEEKAVAQGYQPSPVSVIPTGYIPDELSDSVSKITSAIVNANGNLKAAKKALRPGLESQMIDQGLFKVKRTKASLYEANLRWPDAAREAADPLGPQHFLDWDKPFSQQNQNVRDALGKLDPETYSPKGGDYDANELGQQTYQRLIRGYGTNKVSPMLNAMGVPGIRYLDGGSRNAGQGTSNYVAFDDALAEILSRNGQPLGLFSR